MYELHCSFLVASSVSAPLQYEVLYLVWYPLEGVLLCLFVILNGLFNTTRCLLYYLCCCQWLCPNNLVWSPTGNDSSDG